MALDVSILDQYNYWRLIRNRGRAQLERSSNGGKSLAGLLRLLAEHHEHAKAQAVPQHRQPRNAAAEAAEWSTIVPDFLLKPSAASSPATSATSSAAPVVALPTPSSAVSSAASDAGPQAESSQACHRSSRHSFLGFPPEVRNLIYYASLEYPACRRLYDIYYTQRDKLGYYVQRASRDGPNKSEVAKGKAPCVSIPLRTPTMLLLCKSITLEALSILRTRSFVVDRIPPWLMGDPSPLPLSYFMGKQTLQRLQYIELRVSLGEGIEGSGDFWTKVVKHLIDVLSERHSTIELKVIFRLNHVDSSFLWHCELYDYEVICHMLNDWERKHARRPGTVKYEHWVMDGNYAYRAAYRNPLIRTYGEVPELWQGKLFLS